MRYDLSHPLLKAQYSAVFFTDELSICSVFSVDLYLFHSAQVPAAAPECVLCFPWAQPGLKAFLICVALPYLLSSCLSRGASPGSLAAKHTWFWRSRRAQKGSASPLSARPRERLLLAPLAHARHTSGTSAAGPAMPPDSSPPASVAPTGIYKDLVRGGYLEARGQQWRNTPSPGWPHTKAWTFPCFLTPGWARTMF